MNELDHLQHIARLEQALRKAENDRQAAINANRAKSEQIAAISHDVRTGMGAVISMSELLLGTELEERQRHYARTLNEAARGLMDILNSILDLAKLEAGRLELDICAFDPRQVVGQVAAAMQARADEKQLALAVEVDDNLPEMLEGDPVRLRQALYNLVDNAIKFTTEGQVTLRLRGRDDGDEMVLRFEVMDTGPGLGDDEQARLFRPFEQLHTAGSHAFGGTGLGLSLVRNLARLMGGDSGCTSEKQLGSTFWFEVRCRRAGRVDQQAGRSLSEPAGTAMGGRILVVEDNRVNQLLITTYLEQFGFDHVCAENGKVALELLDEGGFDLVLMDVQMPVMDGLEATRRIRAQSGETATIPILALTANAMKGDRELYLDAGMNDYLSKPINAAALLAMINRYMAMSPERRARPA